MTSHLVVASLLLAGGPALACEPAGIGAEAHRVSGKGFVLDWRAEPAALHTGQFFALVVSVCERDGGDIAALKVDATRPAHKHGMNYVPTIARDGSGRFRAAGLLLHMAGRWEFAFDVSSSGGREAPRNHVDALYADGGGRG